MVKEGNLDGKPPNRVHLLAGCNYPFVYHPTAPVGAYRILSWFRAEKKGTGLARDSDCPDHV